MSKIPNRDEVKAVFKDGAVWTKSYKDKDGNEKVMLSMDIQFNAGTFELHDNDVLRVVAFENSFKEKDNQPDFHIVIRKDPEEK